MKKAYLILFLLISIISCQQPETESLIPKLKNASRIEQFGLNFNDYNVLHDTVQSGDTFGSIIEKQNIGDKQVYDIVNKVKDTFDVRTIRIGKPFTALRSKDRFKKLQFFIYIFI